jgi:hypothetical protein
MPDKSDFKAAACPLEAKAKIKSTDGKAVPLAANVTCYQSEKLTCQIYRNATGHSFISASCKEAAKKKSAAQSTWQHCLLLALLVRAWPWLCWHQLPGTHTCFWPRVEHNITPPPLPPALVLLQMHWRCLQRRQ